MGLFRFGCMVLLVTTGLSRAWAVSHAGEPAAPGAGEWRLAWSDEFDGAEIDRSKWDFDLGNGYYSYDANQWISGWGNAELQYYTRDVDNVFVKDGRLRIRAIKESLHGCGYTSARLKMRSKDGRPLLAQRYGKFEIRAQLPTGQGIWPAIWLMPQDDKYGTWAASGEIDILEARGQEPQKVLGALHFGSRWPANTHVSHEYLLPNHGTIDSDHVYALEWEPGEIRWLVDGRAYAAQSFWWSSSQTNGTQGVPPTSEADLNPWPAPFDQPFYLIMNVAVGGRFLGNPDAKTAFPVEMSVDYVRVYAKAAGYGPPGVRGAGKLPFQQ